MEEAEGGGELKDVLNFSNWSFYMDAEGKKHPTLDQFKAETGITVNYFEDVNSNDEYFAKVQGRLAQGQGIDRDIFVATDNSRFPSLYVDEGWVQPLDKSLIPNFDNLIDAQASPPFDPDRTYSLPWLGGMYGHRLERGPDRPRHDDHAAARGPEAQGQVTMLSEMGDSVGLVLLENGDDPTQVTDESFDSAVAKVQAAVDSGQIRRFTGNDYAQPLANGDLAAAWPGRGTSRLLWPTTRS